MLAANRRKPAIAPGTLVAEEGELMQLPRRELETPTWGRRSLLTQVSAAVLRTSVVLDFILGGYGAAYGVGTRRRAWLALRFQRIVAAIPSGTAALAQIVLAREILSIPPSVRGDVVECGAWKGASSASLSLVCRLARRRLLICDSFAGLPEVETQRYLAPHSRIYGYLKGGMFAGPLAEVRANITTYGAIEVCRFVPGLFAESLVALAEPVAFAFLDVDLPASFRDCLRTIWPLLVSDGAIYIDDVGCMDVASVFFDHAWWQQQLGCPAPGMVGSGCGLPIRPDASNIGYVRKPAPFEAARWRRHPALHYPAGHEEAI
jgi:hypothetical protein